MTMRSTDRSAAREDLGSDVDVGNAVPRHGRLDAVTREVERGIGAGLLTVIAARPALEHDDLDALGAREQRQGIRDGARRLRRGVPGDEHALAHIAKAPCVGNEEHGATTRERQLVDEPGRDPGFPLGAALVLPDDDQIGIARIHPHRLQRVLVRDAPFCLDVAVPRGGGPEFRLGALTRVGALPGLFGDQQLRGVGANVRRQAHGAEREQAREVRVVAVGERERELQALRAARGGVKVHEDRLVVHCSLPCLPLQFPAFGFAGLDVDQRPAIGPAPACGGAASMPPALENEVAQKYVTLCRC
jgi:hypothetical protein